MDKSTDSNSSSWVFVYANINPIESTGNTFHLDCSREPIQELTEQDLASASSDFESDQGTDTSDGISIISEAEIPDETCATYNDCLKIEDINDTHIVENRIVCTSPWCVQEIDDHHNDWYWKRVLTSQNVISVGVVVSAVLLAFYYSLKTQPNDTILDDPLNNFDKVEAVSSIDKIIDTTILCACAEKRNVDETNGIKQCIREHLQYQKSESLSNDNLFPDHMIYTPNKDKTTTESIKENDNDSIQQQYVSTKAKSKDIRSSEKKLEDKKQKHTDKKHKHDNKKLKHKPLKKDQKLSNLSAVWYNNMFKYREELRRINKHINKAQWYFRRAHARQQSRLNYNYKSYSG